MTTYNKYKLIWLLQIGNYLQKINKSLELDYTWLGGERNFTSKLKWNDVLRHFVKMCDFEFIEISFPIKLRTKKIRVLYNVRVLYKANF